MGKKLLAAAVAGMLWAGQSSAVTPQGHEIPYFGAYFSHEFADSARDSSGGNGFQVTIGTPLSWGDNKWGDNNALELSFYNIGRERDIDGKDDYQAALALNAVHDFGLYGWGDENTAKWLPQFAPYVLGGLVAVRDDVRGKKRTSPGLDLGAGVMVPLPWFGAAVRAEALVQGEANDKTVPDQNVLIDYRINIGLQIPLTPIFDRPVEVPPAQECEVAVVDPVTGRRDCGADSDRDGVIDGVDQCPGTPEGTPVDGRGCPASGGGSDADHDGVPDMVDTCPGTTPGIVVDMNGCATEQSMTLKNIYFSNDTAELTDESRKSLDEVAATLRGQPNLRVEIGGHTDSAGSAAYNLMLSQQRAESVRQYLIAHGIDSGRLTAQGYGKFRPRGADAADNRRVEFKLIVE